MKLAIVGTTAKLSEVEERNMRQYISLELNQHSTEDTLVISGGAKGVDLMAIEIAKGLGFKTQVHAPKVFSWTGYKERNLIIAKECDNLVCFTVDVHDTKCYHHGDYTQNHQKTAGCWTLSKAKALLKSTKLLVVLKSGILEKFI